MIFPNSDHPDQTAAAPAAGSGQPAQARAAEQALLDTLYPPPLKPARVEVPENVRALRKDRSDGFYQPPYAEEIAIKVAGMPPEVVLATNLELRSMAQDVGLDAQAAKEFMDLGRQLDANPPDADTEARWVDQAQEALTRRYGAEAEARLDLARALVARDPRLGKLLDATRLGNHPKVIAALVERAQAERNAGRL